jgi:hypothetical protein
MSETFTAFGKAIRDLARGDILWHVFWPPLVAVTLWGLIGFFIWAHGIRMLTQILPQLPWSGWEWVAHWAAIFLLLMSFATLIYLTALLLVAIVVLPHLIHVISARDYPDLVRHGENAFIRSLSNTLIAGVIFIAGILLSLPLLLLPGVILVFPLFWTAWLNQRTFRVDSLVEHATEEELSAIVKTQKSTFYLAGAACSLLAHVPIIQFVTPIFTALVFVHLSLQMLREQRRQEGVTL